MLFVELRLSEEVDQYVTKKKNRSVFCLSSPRVSIRRFDLSRQAIKAKSQEDSEKHGINFWFSVEDVNFSL